MGKKRSRAGYFLAILVFTIVIVAVIILTSYSGPSTQARVPGVSPGNIFTYDVSSFWSSSDTNAVAPQRLLDINQTEFFQVTITDVTDTMVTTFDVWLFENGTVRNSTGLVNVETGFNSGGFWPVVAANLGKNDLLHPAGQNEITVDETIIREYSSGARETNHFKYNYQGNDENYGYYTAESDYYFDRATGMLVELYDRSTFLSTNTQAAILWKIKESNVWVFPEFPSVLILLLFMMATLLAAIAYKKKNTSSTQTQVPAKSRKF